MEAQRTFSREKYSNGAKNQINSEEVQGKKISQDTLV